MAFQRRSIKVWYNSVFLCYFFYKLCKFLSSLLLKTQIFLKFLKFSYLLKMSIKHKNIMIVKDTLLVFRILLWTFWEYHLLFYLLCAGFKLHTRDKKRLYCKRQVIFKMLIHFQNKIVFHFFYHNFPWVQRSDITVFVIHAFWMRITHIVTNEF